MAIDLQSAVWYAIENKFSTKKNVYTIGIYGKTCAGKRALVIALASRIERSLGWHRAFLSLGAYLKVNRETRRTMLDKAYVDCGGLNSAYDAVHLEAYAIDGKAISDDIGSIKKQISVNRPGTYNIVSGKHDGAVCIAMPRWNGISLLVDGSCLADHRASFDFMIRVEAPYEVRKKRYSDKRLAAAYYVPEWNFDALDRAAEKSIFKNWDINDIVVHAEDGIFQVV